MSKQRVYCIFEGAGARGLAHVAAYKTLSRDDVELVGFAGTSAGAMVAALAAVGYSPMEIYDSDKGRGILDILDLDRDNDDVSLTKRSAISPKNLLGKSAWSAIWTIRFIMNRGNCIPSLAAIAIILVVFGGFHAPGLTLILVLLSVVLALYLFLKLCAGFVRLDTLKYAINQLLSIKMHGRRNGPPVTFGHLWEAGRPPLKVVAANISQHKLDLFSAEVTPDVEVADAVCASICLPGIFVKHRIGVNEFLDGGLVSNLPAWAFDDERAKDRDALTAAIEIAQKDKGVGRIGLFASAKSILKTIVFGSGILNTRGVDRLITTRMEVDLGLLDFDLSKKKAKDILQLAERHCEADLIKTMIDLPKSINDACREIADECRKLIAAAYREMRRPRFRGKIRIAVGIPLAPGSRSIRLDFSSGYEDLSDERLVLPMDRSFMGQAWHEDEANYVERSNKAIWESKLNLAEDRWIRKLIWPQLQWLLCVPISFGNTQAKRAVVSLDCDTRLTLSIADQQQLLDALEAHILNRFAFLGDVQEELPSAGKDVNEAAPVD